jgi:predicted transcriptional regulator
MIVRQLSDILIEKVKKVGGKAELGRLIGVTGPAIYQYTTGMMPSLTFAIKWKEAFGENLIDLMFDEPAPIGVAEPPADYGSYKDKYIDALEKLNACREQKEAVEKENSILKNFGSGTERESKLNQP